MDENFIAKVADAGIIRLIQGSDKAGPSNRPSGSIYHDPEYGNFFSKTFPTSFTSYLFLFTFRAAYKKINVEDVNWIKWNFFFWTSIF